MTLPRPAVQCNIPLIRGRDVSHDARWRDLDAVHAPAFEQADHLRLVLGLPGDVRDRQVHAAFRGSRHGDSASPLLFLEP